MYTIAVCDLFTGGSVTSIRAFSVANKMCRGGRCFVVVVVVEASAPKVYPRVTLAIASTLSGPVIRTLRGGERLSNMFYLVASSLGHLRSQCLIVFGSA